MIFFQIFKKLVHFEKKKSLIFFQKVHVFSKKGKKEGEQNRYIKREKKIKKTVCGRV